MTNNIHQTNCEKKCLATQCFPRLLALEHDPNQMSWGNFNICSPHSLTWRFKESDCDMILLFTLLIRTLHQLQLYSPFTLIFIIFNFFNLMFEAESLFFFNFQFQPYILHLISITDFGIVSVHQLDPLKTLGPTSRSELLTF